ncbi:uroporphyrinogen-III synthase [Hyphomonas sp.]|uniref:uroporphyrinogen-III synthase n=1 Tax=Hyphomonas sp. TaxID=87 RepID=UPI00391D9857
MSHPVIVTRTQPGADETAAGLAALGYRPIVSPMLRIVETGLAAEALEGVRDIVFTSANGVRAFTAARAGETAAFAAWCVGPSTAEAAREAGFTPVVESDGDAAALAGLILARRDDLSGPLLHIANKAAAGQLVAALQAGGLEARFAAPYRTEAAPALSSEALEVLTSGSRCAVLVHSAKAADALAASQPPLAHAVIAAISEAAAEPLAHLPAAARAIAARPNEAALMAALKSALA